ncbi:probable serine carboxypeptidase CPVL isoform X6 [Hylobates moloch]|uniref:probable serine carboxypeptidase CPVL isoform X6 n=1 Tax=Hylobates moloch TaxID=81572 RepID=UPI00267535FF|nr:probable serine carboxypeptidase CPVL isoform X6 [Hylobates moloch]
MVGAMWKVIVSLVLLMPGPCDGLFRSLYRSVSMPPKADAGQPLFLTPYIEAGKIQEGRELSLVSPFPGLNMKSYTGFLTVNKTYNSNLFLWFFPAQVGTGFSFTDDTHGYAVSEDDVARDLYSALIQFFQIFPEYKNNDFYVTGESYAGKYVPAIAHLIHSLNPVREVKINLKGIAIGDGYSDPESIIGGYAEFLYQIGLLDEKQKKYFQKQCHECIEHIRKQNWFQAFEILDKLLDGDLTSDPSYFQNVTGCSNYYNFLRCTEPEDQLYYVKFLSLPEVRQAIHVGNRTFNDGTIVGKYLREDTVQSVKPWLTEIMNNYKVLIYNGQLDIIVAAALTERSLMGMDWKGSQEYKKAEKKVWKIFKSDSEVAGYIRQVGDFHQVIIRGGGHILPYDQPLRAFDMINRFIYGKGWDPYVG